MACKCSTHEDGRNSQKTSAIKPEEKRPLKKKMFSREDGIKTGLQETA
jgi:hypothetical protein